ncbi:hypothetical protein NQ318_001009 [Aromia moschata]|uniref:Molybdopterin synthase catalytic subunit n=1 Tax=Aromia moschata TaxID=1265417 RepID=A0AAV8ZGY2_9CUCU|nr:hypothetical protein NQ318_001009 [Aromia moschata]
MNYLKFKHEKLSVEEVTQLVTASSCGAISLFIGTTRDNFENKVVVKLEYEAYESMGIKSMEQICGEIRKQWISVENIAIYHRLGEVPIKEASIIIAVSSPHREDAIKATEWCINNVKKSVPVWKKEVYSDSEPEWKENKECAEKIKLNFEQKVEIPYVLPHLIQIKGSNSEVDERINKFMERKRSEIDINNIREFCCGDRNSEFSCARVDAVLQKRKDSKSHLQVNRVLNSYHTFHLMGSRRGIENLECQLSLTSCPKKYLQASQIFGRQIVVLGINFSRDKAVVPTKAVKKKIFSLEEIDDLIAETEKQIKTGYQSIHK